MRTAEHPPDNQAGTNRRVEPLVSNAILHTAVMAWDETPWAPPLAGLGGMVGHLLAWERHERDRFVVGLSVLGSSGR
jgi:hypothetical protein